MIKLIAIMAVSLGISSALASTPIEDLKYAKALVKEVYESGNLSNQDASTLKLALEKLGYAASAFEKQKDTAQKTTPNPIPPGNIALRTCSRSISASSNDQLSDGLLACISRHASLSSMSTCMEFATQIPNPKKRDLAISACTQYSKN